MAEQRQVRLAVGQMNCVLGDVGANLETIERMAREAKGEGCEMIVFPELATTGYTVGPGFSEASLAPGCAEVKRLKELSREIGVVLGFIEETEDTEFFNSAMYLEDGQIRHVHRKVYLPNYRIFDERRYFGAGQGIWAFDTAWGRMAILICGDMWHMAMPYLAAHDGADILLVLAASSTQGLAPGISVGEAWERMNRTAALTLSNFVVFANRVGSERPPGCEERLEYWGGSHVCLPCGQLLCRAGDGEEVLVGELDLTALRRQRLILPFRRDDSLSFTLDVGRKIVRAKSRRRDGFYGQVAARGTMDEYGGNGNGNGGSALEEQPPTPGGF